MTGPPPANPQPPASDTTQRAGAEPTVQFSQPDAAANTRRAYATAHRQLAAWLNSRPLDDAGLAAYIGHLRATGRAKATATMAVTAARRAARDAGQQPPDGPLTRQALEDFRGTEVAAARRGQTRGLTADECAAILATCTQRRRTGRGLEREETAERRGLVDGAIVGLLFHGALRRSEVAALCWTDVDLSDGEDVVVTRRHAKTNAAGERPDGRRLVGGCAAAVRRLHAATTPEPADPVIGLSGDQINKRFAAACAAAGLEGRRTSHGGRVGLAVELTARGASTHAIQLAGGWKTPSMVVRYAATVATRDGGVSRYLR